MRQQPGAALSFYCVVPSFSIRVHEPVVAAQLTWPCIFGVQISAAPYRYCDNGVSEESSADFDVPHNHTRQGPS
jgi:hypothetical protein